MSNEQNLEALALGSEIVAAHDFDRVGEFFAEQIVDHDLATIRLHPLHRRLL